MIESTDTAKLADVFFITDVKEVAFSGMRQVAPISNNWKEMMEFLKKIAKHPIAHPIYAHLPSVFEREISFFGSIYFIARMNEEKEVLDFCANHKLEAREKTLLKNVKEAYNM